MSRLVNRLNAKSARAIAFERKPGMFPDGDGLYLQVTPLGSVSWCLVYKFRGRRRKAGLGSFRYVTLDQARAKRNEMRRTLLNGEDPLAAKATSRAKTVKTFRALAEEYLADTGAKRKSQVNSAQWRTALLGEATKAIAGLPINSLDTPTILRVLRPVWDKTPETGSRLRARIAAVWDYAAAHGCLPAGADNPASWDRVKFALPARAEVAPVKHFEAMPYAQVPTLMQKLQLHRGSTFRALEWAILTACRTGDIVGQRRADRPPMKWEHVNIEARLWTVPATKMGWSHTVPLSTAALDLLARTRHEHPPRKDDIVFAGHNGHALGDRSLATALKRVTGGGCTTHGMRSAFRDWCAETGVNRETAEACLAHKIGRDQVEQSYLRSDLLIRRRPVMESWSRFLADEGAANVVALRR
jgi:integrase